MNNTIDVKQNDKIVLGLPPETSPVGGGDEGAVANGKSVAPVLKGPSVMVTSPTDLETMMAKLREQINQKREDMVRGRLQTALAAAAEQLRLQDAEQARLVTAIGSKVDEVKALDDAMGQVVDSAANDPRLLDLQIKTKQIEAMIEAEKKTPEETQEEYDRKQQRLKELQAQYDAANGQLIIVRDELDQKVAQARGELEVAQRELGELRGQLNDHGLNAITAALRLATDGTGKIEELDDEKKRADAPDSIDMFLRLLGGEDLSDVIESSIEHNV